MNRPLLVLVALALLVSPLAAGCLDASRSGASATSAPRGATNGSASVTGFVETHGYLTVRDGTQLAYDLILPGDGSGHYPLLLTYDGYDAGSVFDTGYRPVYLGDGYALMGLNVRGTGCSGGTFDFFAPVQGLDGYDAIEWAANQTWSDGNIGMIGKSYPGITQLFVAETQPPHLKAAAPGHVYGDIYRDVVYPGGIYNYAFAGLWSFIAQPEPGYASGLQQSQNDPICAQNIAQHTATNLPTNPFVQAPQHQFDDALIKERSPFYNASKINVPLYMFQSWQDEQVGVRGVDVVENLHTDYWLTLSNGDHGMYRTPTSLGRLHKFFDHFLKGADNGWQNEPRVQVWFDSGANGTRSPGWVRNYTAWPITDVQPLTLYLREGARLSTDAPTGAEASDAYLYPSGSRSNGAGYGELVPVDGNKPPTDGIQTPAPTRAIYTSDPFTADTVAMGPSNLTFWASSTAVDTDFQVVVSEVANGHETYVQKGWLRASHRALDGARSSTYRPFQSHTQSDLLSPGEATQFSMEIFPMGQAFRAGTQLRISIETPTVLPELWGMAILPLPAVNSVMHDAQHVSSLTLPVLAGERADIPEPACGSLIRQSCS